MKKLKQKSRILLEMEETFSDLKKAGVITEKQITQFSSINVENLETKGRRVIKRDLKTAY